MYSVHVLRIDMPLRSYNATSLDRSALALRRQPRRAGRQGESTHSFQAGDVICAVCFFFCFSLMIEKKPLHDIPLLSLSLVLVEVPIEVGMQSVLPLSGLPVDSISRSLLDAAKTRSCSRPWSVSSFRVSRRRTRSSCSSVSAPLQRLAGLPGPPQNVIAARPVGEQNIINIRIRSARFSMGPHCFFVGRRDGRWNW